MPGNEKANPNIAMNEANAMEQWQAAGMAPNYVPLISKDVYGNDITEPDLSNPTRSRHERPLDTIRQFESAAYGKEYTIGGEAGSEVGAMRSHESRQSGRMDNRRSFQRDMSSSTVQMQRNYSYGNMQDQYIDDGSSEIQGGTSRTVPHSNYSSQPSASSWDTRNPGYGSPLSDSGRAQFTAPTPQKLSYTAPPTPPQDTKATQQKKKSWGKRLSFGKNKA